MKLLCEDHNGTYALAGQTERGTAAPLAIELKSMLLAGEDNKDGASSLTTRRTSKERRFRDAKTAAPRRERLEAGRHTGPMVTASRACRHRPALTARVSAFLMARYVTSCPRSAAAPLAAGLSRRHRGPGL